MSLFSLTKRADYALSLLSLLSGKERGYRVSLSDMAKLGLPRAFMAQIANDLVKGDILDSREGRGGGYGLKREPGEVTVREALEAVEGEILPVECKGCSAQENCCQKGFMENLGDEMRDLMEGYTLIDLVSK